MKDILTFMAMYGAEMLIGYMLIGSVLNFKYSRKITVASFLVAYGLLLAVHIFINVPNVNLSAFMIINSLLCLFLCHTDIKRALVLSMAMTAIMVLTEVVTIYLMTVLLGTDVTTFEYTGKNYYVYILQMTACKTCYLVACKLMSIFLNKKFGGGGQFYSLLFYCVPGQSAADDVAVQCGSNKLRFV